MTAQTTQMTRRSGWRVTLETNWFFLLVFGVLLIFPWLVGAVSGTSPTARRGEAVFQQSIMVEYLIFAMLAMSYNLMFGFTGVISFGHAMFFGIGGYLLGGFVRAFGGDVGVPLGLLAAVGACGMIGLLIGFVSLRLRGVYFAMFTLAIAEMVYIFMRRNPTTGSEDGFGLTGIPAWYDPTQNRIVFYYIVVLTFAAMFMLIRRLMMSPTGAVLLGVRENENRARSIGYNTLKFKLLAITVAGVLAAIAGVLFSLLNKKVGPEMLFVSFTVNPLLYTIVGGIGTFTGPVVGAVGLSLLDRQLRDASLTIGDLTINIGHNWAIILGIIFIVVVLVFPQGIVGTYNRWYARFRARRSGARAAPAASAGD
jgi:branched-chain amino acid transport system permease protein